MYLLSNPTQQSNHPLEAQPLVCNLRVLIQSQKINKVIDAVEKPKKVSTEWPEATFRSSEESEANYCISLLGRHSCLAPESEFMQPSSLTSVGLSH